MLATVIALPLLFLLADVDVDRAVVTLSTGETAEGRFTLPPGRKLEIWDLARKRRIPVEASEVARVAVSVEEERLEQGWMWKEESNHDKIKLPYRYPLRKLLTQLTLVSGETLRGHLTLVFTLDTEDDSKRFFLLADQKGEKGQELAALAYVKDVAFPGRKVEGTGKLGKLSVRGQAAIVSVERGVSYQPPFTGLLAGRYDVFRFDVERGEVRYGLSGVAAVGAALAAVEAKLAAPEEFYTRKKIVAATERAGEIHAFLELAREETTTDPANAKFLRWELWSFAPTPGGAATITRRLYLHRHRATGALPAIAYAAREALRSVAENAVLEDEK